MTFVVHGNDTGSFLYISWLGHLMSQPVGF